MKSLLSLVATVFATAMGGCGASGDGFNAGTAQGVDAGSDARTSVSPVQEGDAGPHKQSPRKCAVTLSGGVVGSYACTMPMSTWSSESNSSAVVLSSPVGEKNGPQISVSAGFSGPPAVKIYAGTDPDTKTSMTITLDSNVWTVVTGSGSTPQGTYSLSIASVTGEKKVAKGKNYRLSGTIDATLASASTADAITMHIEFD